MISPHTRLSHYKRPDIQREMALHAKGREVAARFGDKFGSRPDIINNPGDILEFAKQGATSFHCSEELWRNPLLLKTEMTRQEQDSLRTGWDLVIDVDCPVWEYSRLIAYFIIQALKENGVSSISCKFSGNKGFHIGVPFEAFPAKAGDQETRLRFPDGVRAIASYLVSEIDRNNRLSDFILKKGLLNLLEKTGRKRGELIHTVCSRCAAPKAEEQAKFEYICASCQRRDALGTEEEVRYCPRCKKMMERMSLKRRQDQCVKCRGRDFRQKLDIEGIMSIDSLLISSRHLYRMPYSLHEKSGLVSLPLDPEKVLFFEREMANPERVVIPPFRFLDREKTTAQDAAMLFENASQWHTRTVKENEGPAEKQNGKTQRDFELTEALPPELFPPCIQLILNGMGDGKKRAVFILINFLRSVGYDYAQIEAMIGEWNKKNKEPLREVVWRGQLNYHKQQAKQALPPNCRNLAYMVAIGVCRPDSFCPAIKNPAQYTKKKAWLLAQGSKGKKGKKKADEKQKAAKD